jgi:hypothetical protein
MVPSPTPRGTTTRTALQARHRYRRTAISIASGTAPGDWGPSSPRRRKPWPTICSGRPGSRLATAHAGQRLGRTAAHEGGDLVQNLTSASQWMIRKWLRVSNVRAEHGGTGARNTAPPLYFRRPFVGAPPPRASLRRCVEAAPEIEIRDGQPHSLRYKPITLRARDRPSTHHLPRALPATSSVCLRLRPALALRWRKQAMRKSDAQFELHLAWRCAGRPGFGREWRVSLGGANKSSD